MGTLPKLLRRTFYTAAAVSAMLLLVVLILWLVSYYRTVEASYCSGGKEVYCLDARSGRAEVGRTTWAIIIHPHGWYFDAFNPTLGSWSYLTWNAPDSDFRYPPDIIAPTFLGMCWFHVPPGSWEYEGVAIPLSYLALLSSIIPLLAFRSIHRRRKLARVGHCPKCHYDLRAHAPGTRCPECGTPVPVLQTP